MSRPGSFEFNQTKSKRHMTGACLAGLEKYQRIFRIPKVEKVDSTRFPTNMELSKNKFRYTVGNGSRQQIKELHVIKGREK